MLSPVLSCTSLGITWDKTTPNHQHVNCTQSPVENQSVLAVALNQCRKINLGCSLCLMCRTSVVLGHI